MIDYSYRRSEATTDLQVACRLLDFDVESLTTGSLFHRKLSSRLRLWGKYSGVEVAVTNQNVPGILTTPASRGTKILLIDNIMATLTPTLRPLSCWKLILRQTRQQKSATRWLTTYHKNISFSKISLPSPPPPGFVFGPHGLGPNPLHQDLILTCSSQQQNKSLPTTSISNKSLPRTDKRPHHRPNRRPRSHRCPHPPLLQSQPRSCQSW